MRSDMFQVIIERPRWGHGCGDQSPRPRDLESAPRQEPMSRRRFGSKQLSENLAPLRRFLRSRVGRRWDEVHSEIAAQLSLGSAVQKHVLDHLDDMVEQHPQIIDGRPHRAIHATWHRQPPRPLGLSREEFYVCPRTGRLRLALVLPGPAPEVERDRVVLDADHEARRIDGQWYAIGFAPLPVQLPGVRDVLLRRALTAADRVPWSGALAREHGRADRYAASKRQLSRREVAEVERRLACRARGRRS